MTTENRVRSHEDLFVWQKSITFVTQIYKMTEKYPTHELYGLTNQIRRAAVSIPSNIAEGAGRKNTKEFIQFLYIARGSASELETQIIIAKKLGYMNDEESLISDITIIRKMLNALITSLRKIVNGGY